MNNGKSFSKIRKPTEQDGAYYLKFDFSDCRRLMKDWKLEVYEMVRKFPPFRSEWKKRSTSGGTLQSLIGFSKKKVCSISLSTEISGLFS